MVFQIVATVCVGVQAPLRWDWHADHPTSYSHPADRVHEPEAVIVFAQIPPISNITQKQVTHSLTERKADLHESGVSFLV